MLYKVTHAMRQDKCGMLLEILLRNVSKKANIEFRIIIDHQVLVLEPLI
jgi:hypothetical protein